MIKLINTPDGLNEVTQYLLTKDIVGIDTETSSLSPFDGRLLVAQVGEYELQYVIDVKALGEDAVSVALRPLESILCIGHNLKFDWKWLYHSLGIDIKNIFDTFVAENMLHTGYKLPKGSLSLEACCRDYFGVKLKKEIRGKVQYQGLTEEVLLYCAEDIKYLYTLRLRQLEKLKQWYKDTTLIDLEMRTTRVLAKMEYDGILLDTVKWTGVYEETSANRLVLESKLDQVVQNDKKLARYVNSAPQLELGFEDIAAKPIRESVVNWQSPKQKLEILHTLGIQSKSTDAKDLIKLRRKHPIVPLLMDYSQANKLASSFGKEFLRHVNKHTHNLHPNFFQIVSSGRMSCSDPNLLNIPRKGKLGKVIRSCFIARPGYKLVASDFSNFELRITAEFAEEPIWDDVFLNNGDLHTVLCMKTFDIPLEQVHDPFPAKPEVTYREIQKTVDFMLSYGGSEYKLSSVIDVSINKAKEIIQKFFSVIPKVKLILDIWSNVAVTNGYIKTPAPYRRVRWFPQWKELQSDTLDDFHRLKLIGEISREAKNQVPQGTNGDVIKDVLCTLQDLIDENHFPVELKIAVYDEVVSEAREDFAEEWALIKQDIMIKCAEKVIHRIPIKVEVNIDDYWKH